MPTDRRQHRQPPAVAVARQHRRRPRTARTTRARSTRRVGAQRRPVAVDDRVADRLELAHRLVRRRRARLTLSQPHRSPWIAHRQQAARPASSRRTAASSPPARSSTPAGASGIGRAASPARVPLPETILGRDKRALLAQSRRPHALTSSTSSTRSTTFRDSSASAVCALIAAIVFAETGLLVGFFLPGDSLLVTAGHLLHQRQPERGAAARTSCTLNLASIVAAIVGDTVGYWIGAKAGPDDLHPRAVAVLLEEAPAAHQGVLRTPRRQDDHHRPLHAVPPHVRARRRRRRQDELPPVPSASTSSAASAGCSA